MMADGFPLLFKGVIITHYSRTLIVSGSEENQSWLRGKIKENNLSEKERFKL